MLAVVAAILFLLAFLNVTFAGHSLIALGLVFLAAHLAYPVGVLTRRA